MTWFVVVRADELAKDDSPESTNRDAMVLAAAHGARTDWVLGCLQEGHIHAAGGAAAAGGGDGGGVPCWPEFVV